MSGHQRSDEPGGAVQNDVVVLTGAHPVVLVAEARRGALTRPTGPGVTVRSPDRVVSRGAAHHHTSRALVFRPSVTASEESVVPVVHFQPDTLPRVERATGGARVDLVVPFRFTVDIPNPATTWVLRATVNGNACEGIAPTTITHAFVQDLRKKMQRDGMFDFDHLAPYVEYHVPGLQPGAHVTYVLEPADPQAGSLTATYGIYAVAPEFGRADIRRIKADDVMHPERAWVLYHRRATNLHHVRIDVATLVQDPDTSLTDNGIADLAVTIGDRTFDLRDTRITNLGE